MGRSIKKGPFVDDASPGSIGLESMFGLMCNQFTLEKTIDILTRRKIQA